MAFSESSEDLMPICQALLKPIRATEDNMIYRLNQMKTYDQKHCESFKAWLHQLWQQRKDILQNCMDKIDERILEESQKSLPSPSPSSLPSLERLKQQRNWLSSQWTVESIIQEKSLQLWKSKCRFAMHPI